MPSQILTRRCKFSHSYAGILEAHMNTDQEGEQEFKP